MKRAQQRGIDQPGDLVRVPLIRRGWFAPLLCLMLLVILGTAGYILIEKMSWLDGLYMTIITLATVGYRELKAPTPAGKIFTMLLIGFGVATATWAVRTMVETLWQEQLTERRRRRRMQNRINQLEDHFIICGYGRIGREVSRFFARRGVPHLVIDIDPQRLALAEAEREVWLQGNAHDDAVLHAAGIERAKGLVAVAGSDAENVYIVLSARGLNPRLLIVARSAREEDVPKLEKAGADRVISPYVIGGRRLAAAAVYPTLSDFLDIVMHSERLEVELMEVSIPTNSSLAGKTLREADIRAQTGAVILAKRSANGQILVHVTPQTPIAAGDTLVAVGTVEQLKRLEDLV